MSTLGSTSYFRRRIEQSQSRGGEERPLVNLSGDVTKAELESYLSVANAR